MKKYYLLHILIIVFVSFASSQNRKINYLENTNQGGYRVIKSENKKIDINYSISNFQLTSHIIDELEQYHVFLPGVFLFNEAGMPDLATESKYIAIPNNSKAKLIIKNIVYETIKSIEIAPSPILPLDNDKNPMIYKRDKEIYSKDVFYPAQPILISKETKIRGVDAIILSITPFQYNPVLKELKILKNIELSIEFEGESIQFGENRLRSKYWEPILESMFLNYNNLPKIDFTSIYNNTDATGCEYLIITPTSPEFLQWADTLKKFRTEQGILTQIKTLTDVGANTTAALESYINNAYNTWTIPPSAILLLGDHGTNATNSITSTILNDHPGGFNPYISDNPYADVNNDNLPDIAFARITARDASELEVMIKKNLNYERTPPTDTNFYKNPVTALGWQTERWFQICSEVVGGFWKNTLGKTPIRINAVYDGDPSVDPWSSATNTSTVVNYFGPTGLGYIPSTPQTLGGWTGGVASQINNSINNGAFMLLHRDHGLETGWGEPSYTNTNINSLTNSNLTFIMSINCQTGKFDYSSECFAEKFHRHQSSGVGKGALGLIAATEVSYSFVNDVYLWGMFDNLWTNFMPSQNTNPSSRDIRPCFGNVAGKHFLQASSWPYNTNNKNITYNLFHHHGDAFMWVYSEKPQNLNVVHNPTIITGQTSFSVNANIGSQICISYNNQILGTGIGTGSPVDITLNQTVIPSQVLKIVVTKQNYFRYENYINVISSNGPYVVYQNNSVNDTTYGNSNSIIEYGENILLGINLSNVGSANATNIVAKISTNSNLVSIIDSTENYGTINSNSAKFINNAFRFIVSDTIPNNTVVPINLKVTDGTNTWNSSFSLNISAPVFNIQSFIINDAVGGDNDGVLEAGETAYIYFPSQNTSIAKSLNTISNLSFQTGTSNPYLSINTSAVGPVIVNGGDTILPAFSIYAANSTPVGTPVNLKFQISAGQNNHYKFTSEQTVVIGFVPVYCSAGSTATSYEYISNISIGNINQSSTRGTGGYQDFTTQIINLTLGQTLNAIVAATNPYSSDKIKIWVDWNKNGLFTDSGEEVYASSGNGFISPHTTTSFSTPLNAILGQTRLRIRLYDNSSGPNATPCGTSSWGEVEDYTINIIDSISTPTITVSPTTLAFGNITVGQTSTAQSFTVSGANLTANITITAPTGYTISTTSGGTYASTLTLTQTAGTVANTTIYVKFSPTAVQSYSGNITNVSTGATTKNVAVSGAGIAAPTPTITVSPSTLSFSNVVVGQTSTLTYTVSGSNLTNNITLTAPTGYTISTTSGGTYASTLTLTQTAGIVANTTIYVKFSPTAVQSYSGNITNVSTGATTQNVAVSANGSVSIVESISNTLNLKAVPNPFTDKTKIEYNLNQISSVELKIFDITGKELQTIFNENQNIGKQSFELNLTNLQSGIYIYSLKVDNQVFKGKLLKY